MCNGFLLIFLNSSHFLQFAFVHVYRLFDDAILQIILMEEQIKYAMITMRETRGQVGKPIFETTSFFRVEEYRITQLVKTKSASHQSGLVSLHAHTCEATH